MYTDKIMFFVAASVLLIVSVYGCIAVAYMF